MLAQHSDRVKHGGGTTGGAYMGVARVREGTPLRRIDIKVYPSTYSHSITSTSKYSHSMYVDKVYLHPHAHGHACTCTCTYTYTYICQVYPELLEASALLHFTGSGKFNRSLSRLANQAG